MREIKIVFVDFDADAVSPPTRSGNRRRASSHEGIEDGVPDEAEHPHQALSELFWEGRWVLSRRRAGQIAPDLLKPLLVVFR
jgi:hypothetical protein